MIRFSGSLAEEIVMALRASIAVASRRRPTRQDRPLLRAGEQEDEDIDISAPPRTTASNRWFPGPSGPRFRSPCDPCKGSHGTRRDVENPSAGPARRDQRPNLTRVA